MWAYAGHIKSYGFEVEVLDIKETVGGTSM